MTDEKEKKFDTPENDSVEAAVQVFRCDLCSVSCSDANNLALHKNGRKHRNRVTQAEEEEQKQVAAAILEDKRRQMLFSDGNERKAPAPLSSSKKKNPWDKPDHSVQPRYRLPPPPHFPSLGETIASKPSPHTKATTSFGRSLRQGRLGLQRVPSRHRLLQHYSAQETFLHWHLRHGLRLVARTPAPAASVAAGFSSTRIVQLHPRVMIREGYTRLETFFIRRRLL